MLTPYVHSVIFILPVQCILLSVRYCMPPTYGYTIPIYLDKIFVENYFSKDIIFFRCCFVQSLIEIILEILLNSTFYEHSSIRLNRLIRFLFFTCCYNNKYIYILLFFNVCVCGKFSAYNPLTNSSIYKYIVA